MTETTSFNEVLYLRQQLQLAEARVAELEGEKARLREDYDRLMEQVESLKKQTRCPQCGCATPEDAEAAECGCNGPVCMLNATETLAEAYERECRESAELQAALAAKGGA